MHKRLFRYRHGVLYLTRLGAQYTDLSLIKTIPLYNYEHELMTIEIYIHLMKQYPGARWISRRHLLKHKFKEQLLGKRCHVADGIFILPDEKRVAIEVELGLKSEKRLENIIHDHACDFSLHEIWYYCSPKAIGRVRKMIGKLPFIKAYEISKFSGES